MREDPTGLAAQKRKEGFVEKQNSGQVKGYLKVTRMENYKRKLQFNVQPKSTKCASVFGGGRLTGLHECVGRSWRPNYRG